MRSKLALVTLVACLAGPLARGADAPQEPRLSKAFTLSAGDFFAIVMSTTLTSARLVDMPFTIVYERKTGRLVIRLLGARSTVETARESMAPAIEACKGFQLSDDECTIVYENREKHVEIVRREGGKFFSP